MPLPGDFPSLLPLLLLLLLPAVLLLLQVLLLLCTLLLLHEERQQQVERPSPFGRRLRLSCSSREVGTVVGVEVGTYDGVDVGTCDGAMDARSPPPPARTSGRATAPWSGPRSAGTRACPSGRRRGRGGTQASPWQATKAFAFVSARARDKPAWTGSRTGKRGTFPTGRRALAGSRMRRTFPPCGRAAGTPLHVLTTMGCGLREETHFTVHSRGDDVAELPVK